MPDLYINSQGFVKDTHNPSILKFYWLTVELFMHIKATKISSIIFALCNINYCPNHFLFYKFTIYYEHICNILFSTNLNINSSGH